MKHLMALGMKFVATSIVLLSILSIFSGARISEILLVSLLLTLVSYALGDLFILPRFGNVVATIADFGLSFLLIWFMGYLFLSPTVSIITASIFAAIFISLTEALIHAYLLNRTNREENRRTTNIRMNQYQTEFAQEVDPIEKTKKK